MSMTVVITGSPRTTPIWEFDRSMMKRIRDLPEFADKRSVADSVVSRFGTLWDFAEEHLDLDELAALNGANPALSALRSSFPYHSNPRDASGRTQWHRGL